MEGGWRGAGGGRRGVGAGVAWAGRGGGSGRRQLEAVWLAQV